MRNICAMPSPSMKVSWGEREGYCRSGPQRYSVPDSAAGISPWITSRSATSDSARCGAPQPWYSGISGNRTTSGMMDPFACCADTILVGQRAVRQLWRKAMIEPNTELHEPGLTQALADLHSVLVPAERIEAWATQRRVYALSHRRMIVAATSGRLIWLVRRLVSGFDVVNLRWQDLSEVNLRVGIFAAELVIRADPATDLAINAQQGSRLINIGGLRKDQAQAVY